MTKRPIEYVSIASGRHGMSVYLGDRRIAGPKPHPDSHFKKLPVSLADVADALSEMGFVSGKR